MIICLINYRDCGLVQRLEITRANRLILKLWIKFEKEIQRESSKMANGMNYHGISNNSVSYVLIQAPPNAKGFEKAEV